MPELAEEMYCSQQICIPPTFPYLLRQFAKAAIRTQPNDLLKWATAYFRCLSLNIPPPVKPRLEYPVPKDHLGMTPGWLKALVFQLHGTETVSFKLLWDRWIGACLEHNNLIQILCLGGFTDNLHVPWLRFLALCAGFLTENLTQTMILICEILTEEPEGGSAMINVNVFLDLYQFLAKIDASVGQTLKNYYFLDCFLGLYEDKIAADQGPADEGETESEAEVAPSEESSFKEEERTKKEDDGTSVVSCPSVPSDDQDNYLQLLKKVQEDEIEEEMNAIEILDREKEASKQSEAPVPNLDPDAQTDQKEECSSLLNPDDINVDDQTTEAKKKEQELPPQKPNYAPDEHATEDESKHKNKRKCEAVYNEKCLEEDLARLKALHSQLLGGESDDELEKYKAGLIADMHLTESQLKASIHYQTKIESPKSEKDETEEDVKKATIAEKVGTDKDEPYYEEVFVEAVPGIGKIVPDDAVKLVCDFMNRQAHLQQGMVMPRNVRHYDCPPLEIIDVY